MTDDELMTVLSQSRDAKARKAAFDVLFERHGGVVLGYSRKILNDSALAEDASQEVWLKVVLSSATYQGHGQFRSWLLTCCRNQCFNFLRSKTVRLQKVTEPNEFERAEDENLESSQTLNDATDLDLNPLNELIAKENQAWINQAMGELSVDQRQALSLLLIENLSYVEIAQATGLSVSQVKTAVFRGKTKLIQMFRQTRSS